MIYPDFNDLIALKDRKSTLVHPSNRVVKSTSPGNHHSPFRGRGLEFDAVRQYVFGDDIRSIDWRVTARAGAPHLKIFKEERERQMVVCIDMNEAMRFGTRNTFKSVQAAKVAACLSWKGIACQDKVGATLFGDVLRGLQFFSPKRTQKSLCGILKILTETPVEQNQVGLEIAIRHINRAAQTGSLIYFISDFMNITPQIQQEIALSSLCKKCDVVFIAINDLADQSLYPVGSLGFSYLKSETLFINTDSIAGREAYANQWTENRKLLQEVTTKFKIPLIELTTESDIRQDLTMGLKNIARGKKK